MFSFGPCSGKVMAGQSNREEAEKLLQQVAKLTDIRAPGTHSFRLTAHLTIKWPKKGPTSEGAYSLFWNSPDSWRDEVSFADYSQVRVVEGNKLFVFRNPPRPLPEVFRLLALLECPQLFRLTPETNVQYLKVRGKKGKTEKVVGVSRGGASWKIVVPLDSPLELPTRVEYSDSDLLYVFNNYTEFDGHQFPHTLTRYERTKTVLEVRVDEIGEATFEPASFAPPANAKVFSWCAHPQPARPTGLHELSSFIRPTRGLTMNPVAIYGVIGKDGILHDFTVLRSASKGADSYSFWLNQLSQERFIPAKCGDDAVEEEFVMEIFPR